MMSVKKGLNMIRPIRRSYRARITFWMALLLTVFLIVGYMETFLFAQRYLVDKSHDFLHEEAAARSEQLESLLAQVEDVSLSILGNNVIQNALRQRGSIAERDRFLSGESIRQSLSSYALLLPEVVSIGILERDGTLICYNKNRVLPKDLTAIQQQEVYALRGKTAWYADGSVGAELSCVRAINYFPEFLPTGILSVTFSEAHLRELYGGKVLSEAGWACLLDGENRVISSIDGEMLGKSLDGEYSSYLTSAWESYHIQSDRKGVFLGSRMENGWRLMLTMPASFYMKGMDRLSWLFAASTVVMTVLAVLALVLLTRTLTRPIADLNRAMEDFGSGNLDAQCEVTTEDELGHLGTTFNKMIYDMNQLYMTAYRQQLLRQDAELQALQMQINPHFLYNTLDTINWRARFAGADDVGEMAYSLGCLLRYSISGGDFTVFGKEVESLRHYLQIQNYRYSDRLQVRMELDPAFDNIDIPKLLLQPIVENAIIHGIEEKLEGGTVTIRAELDGDDFLVHVIDDGVGMTQQTREAVLQEQRKNDLQKKPHIGIYNVHRRLQLYYGREYGLTIDSEIGQGTTVTMRIKALREPEDGPEAKPDLSRLKTGG